ncbi:MAG: glycosyltransferase family 4 protein [Desulfobacterales bacterium]|nr:glycosyltransferase family 4 protein [Desulfobacterales bacterium]MDD4072982.1 glycosyltransferase family 4 protein [Desulfobacterales bacterium]MDD4392866.1 glycosyltransferase family 4 protein [Desulfobacterales bacterium]
MRICFCTPFKPLDCQTPSGDLVIASGLYSFLKRRGHQIWPAPSVRMRWIFWKFWLWPRVLRDRARTVRYVRRARPDLWLTYHTYYKAPDVLGPFVSSRTNIFYIVFQGIYSTRRKRHWRTRPGFKLNTIALRAAAHVFTNRREDLDNLNRIILPGDLTYIKPGIFPDRFAFSADARAELRQQWNVGDAPVIVSAAMFRPGVKSQGLAWVIRACAALFKDGRPGFLVIAGDGKERKTLRRLADDCLPGRVRFVGKIDRNNLYRFYSAGDIFAFPGIRESLGMVFLEAQSCGLPVVAFLNGGIPEVVQDQKTGFLVPVFDMDVYVKAMERLISDMALRRIMGDNAKKYVRTEHDLDINYQQVEAILNRLSASRLSLRETMMDSDCSGHPVKKSPSG